MLPLVCSRWRNEEVADCSPQTFRAEWLIDWSYSRMYSRNYIAEYIGLPLCTRPSLCRPSPCTLRAPDSVERRCRVTTGLSVRTPSAATAAAFHRRAVPFALRSVGYGTERQRVDRQRGQNAAI